MDETLKSLIIKEGWTIDITGEKPRVVAFGEKFPFTHPALIWLKIYRDSKNPDQKYAAMKAVHDYFWPQDIVTWNAWDERAFKVHCGHWQTISWAGGASTGKSVRAAKICIIEFLCDPKRTGVIVASTTLESIKSRVYGYILSYLRDCQVKFNYQKMRSNPPKILYDRDDEVHSISAIAAARGVDSDAIKNYIGRHPKRKMFVCLDEGPDLDSAVLPALANLDSGGVDFQILVIGNSYSKFDLHGSLSTPKLGWKSIDPMKDVQWETTQKNGICLFFSCYESPAIHEADPVKRAALSKFLVTQDTIKKKILEYGADSDSFWRFVLGYWKSASTEDTVINKEFIADYPVTGKAEWSGFYPLHMVAGLDPAFSTGGDECILRLAVLGQSTNGQVMLDYMSDKLLFKIQLYADSTKSADLQIADQVLKILSQHNVPLGDLCVDANGQGRGLAEVIKLRANSYKSPIKIYSTNTGIGKGNSFDLIVKSGYELWYSFRDFIMNGQIKGLDNLTTQQLTSRQIKAKGGKQVLESKKEFKTRMSAISSLMAHSPDHADAAALCLQSAIINYGFNPGERKALVLQDGFAHDKFWVHNQLKMEENKTAEARSLESVGSGFASNPEDNIPFKPFLS